jgi:putative DNA primase/helicase
VFEELDKLTRKEATAVKSFLTRRRDDYVEKYEKHPTRRERTCCFAGTTNESDWNKDPTGARRFWPVRCRRADDSWVADNRDQLWAEAVARYKAGELWWLCDALEAEAGDAQRERREHDVWTESVATWVDGQKRVLADEVFRMALGFDDLRHVRRPEQLRVAAILRDLGYEPKKLRLGRRWALCTKPDCADSSPCSGCSAPKRGWERP